MLTQNADGMFRDSPFSLHAALLNFLPFYFSSTFVQIRKAFACFHGSVSKQRLDDSLFACNFESRMVVSGSKLMSMPFEILSVYTALVLF